MTNDQKRVMDVLMFFAGVGIAATVMAIGAAIASCIH